MVLDGRRQLLIEALQYAGDSITAIIEDAASDGCLALIRKFVAFWESTLTDSHFAAGCSVVAAAIGSSYDDPALIAIAGKVFDRWREGLSKAFVADGFDGDDAGSLAITCIASLEGAVVLRRSARSAEPLREGAQQIEFLIKSREFVRRHGLPSTSR